MFKNTSASIFVISLNPFTLKINILKFNIYSLINTGYEMFKIIYGYLFCPKVYK